MKSAYYNEIEPYAAQWLKNLIAAKLIAPGDVDERSIADVAPSDLAGYTQCHFFAGLGGWSYAARLAGWPDDRPLWTGSCPCQPFSNAGKGAGLDDERHLWPHFHHLIRECRPPVVMGEQVASKDGLAWLDLVQTDMEGEGYAFGASDTCSAGFGAPHIRQRLYWLADAANGDGRGRERGAETGTRSDGERGRRFASSDSPRWLADNNSHGLGASAVAGIHDTEHHAESRGVPEWLAHHHHQGLEGRREPGCERTVEIATRESGVARIGAGPTHGFWRDADWLYCRDAKWRPVESGTFPLAHGAPARVGRLRAYGNAINAQQAAEVIRAYMECRP